MDRMIYTAMTGANAAAARQAVLSNNLANASTNGFRAELSTFRAVPVRGDGASTRVMALEATSGELDTPGAAQRTDRNLDAMTVGKAWFGVQALDGTESYTRSGSFDVSPDGTLLTSTGLTVLSDGGAPITAPANAEVTIGFDGTLSAKVGNQAPSAIGRLKLVTPEAPLTRGEDGLFRAAGGDLPADSAALLQSGALEDSNVDLSEELVDLIVAQRNFQANAKTIETNTAITQTIINLRS